MSEILNNLAFVIGTLGLIGTIYGLYITLKEKKHPGNIIFIESDSIGMFHELTKKFEQISITFDSKPIEKNIVYLKFSIFNAGSIDIDLRNAESPINIILPKKTKWVSVFESQKSSNLQLNLQTKNNASLIIDGGLFRKHEFIEIEGLVELKSDKLILDKIIENIEIEHRIPNVANVEKINIENDKRLFRIAKNSSSFYYYRTIFVVFFIGLIIFSDYIGDFNTKSEVLYKLNDKLFELTKIENDSIFLEKLNDGKIRAISISDFEKTVKPIISNRKKYSDWIFKLMLFLLAGLGVLTSYGWYSDAKLWKKIKYYVAAKEKSK